MCRWTSAMVKKKMRTARGTVRRLPSMPPSPTTTLYAPQPRKLGVVVDRHPLTPFLERPLNPLLTHPKFGGRDQDRGPRTHRAHTPSPSSRLSVNLPRDPSPSRPFRLRPVQWGLHPIVPSMESRVALQLEPPTSQLTDSAMASIRASSDSSLLPSRRSTGSVRSIPRIAVLNMQSHTPDPLQVNKGVVAPTSGWSETSFGEVTAASPIAEGREALQLPLPRIVPVEKQQVTTFAVQEASVSRRQQEARFVCPIPGCGITFTRRFNLQGTPS